MAAPSRLNIYPGYQVGLATLAEHGAAPATRLIGPQACELKANLGISMSWRCAFRGNADTSFPAAQLSPVGDLQGWLPHF